MMADEDNKQAILRVQCVMRGFLERHRFKKRKLLTFRQNYQKQFDSVESLIKFKFESYGAVLVIQRWFRRWRYYNKQKWQKKYKKMITKYRRQKLLFESIKKSRLTNFLESDLDVKRKVQIASGFVISRLVRGFLGRQKARHYRRRKEIFEEKKDDAAVVVQAFFRRGLAILHYPNLGYRYRAHARKKKLYEEGKLPIIYAHWETCPDEVRLERRISVLYPHLRLAPLEGFPQLDYYATVIQCLLRSILAKAVVRRKRLFRQIIASKRIQKWWAGLGWRRKLKLALSRIQPLWKKKIKNTLKMKHSAIKIQTKFRSYKHHKRYLILKNHRDIATKKLQRWAHYRVCLHRIRDKVSRARSHREMQKAGADLFQASYINWLCYYTWMGIKRTKQKDVEGGNHELQRIFSANALNNGLDLTKILKLFKECKDLMSEDFTTNAVELQFTKIKATNEKRIDYAKFIDLLANLGAVKFLHLDPPKGCWEEIASDISKNIAQQKVLNQFKNAPSSSKENTNTVASAAAGSLFVDRKSSTAPSNLGPIQLLKSFNYGGLYGKAALITKFVLSYFVHLFDFKHAIEFLGNRAAESVAHRTVQDNALIIKTFILNRNAVKQITRNLANTKAEKQRCRLYKSASAIQCAIRSYLAKRQITKMAQLIYSKFVDGETETEYWFNPRTQVSYWSKPKMLGIYDCGMAVRMPKPEEMFSVNCSICEKVSATCYCQQCDSPMCTSCFAKVHKSGQRKGHQHILVDNCVQCDFQIGTKFCQTCKDIFCDSCFRHMHKKGRLRFHSCIRYSSVCDECEDRSAHWREVSTMGALSVKNWCTTCFRNFMGHEPAETKAKRDANGLEKIRFFGKQVQLFMQQREKEKKEKEIKEIFEKRQKELQIKKTLDAVVTIQRVWRGYKGRRKIHHFVQERKEMLLVRYDEDRLRESWLYKLKTLIGFPPKLKSDTPLERVKKLYPWYMHRIVAECIENQWSEACKLLVQHEERLTQSMMVLPSGETRRRKTNILQNMMAKWQVMWARRKCDQMEKKMVEAEILVDAAATSYYNGEASGALPETKLRALKAAMNKMEKQLQKIQEKKTELEQELYDAEEHMYDCVGPRGLQTLVNERRRYGVPLPFRLSIRHNSRLALVEWIPPLHDEEEILLYREGEDEGGGEGALLDANGDVLAQDNDDARSNLTDDPLMAQRQSLKNYNTSNKTNNNNSNKNNPESDPLNSSLTLNRVRRSQSSKSKKFQREATVDYELRPGEWRKKLRTGDQIFIDNATFTVSVPLIAKKKLSARATSAGASSGGSNTARSNSNMDNSGFRPNTAGNNHSNSNNNTNTNSNSNKRSSRPSTSEGVRSGQDKSNANNNDDDDEEEKELIEPFTDNHIPLDRPWILPDTFGVDVFKKVTPIFYMRPYYIMKKLLVNSYPFQKFAQIMGINWHKIASLCEYIAEFFDEESPSRPFYLRLAMSATEKKHYWLKMSKTVVNMSYDFSIRKNSYRYVRKLGKMLYAVVKMVKNVVKAANNVVNETPYEYWQRSLEKSDIRVFYEISPETEIVLGEFRMDLQAPLEIMREYIYRTFREKLNETVGESFLFLQIDEESEVEKVLPRDDEFKTPSKTFALKRTDNKTFESFLSITIIRDQQRARVLIPEFNVKPKNDEDGGEEEQSLLSDDD